MAAPMLTHRNRICAQCISLGPFTGSRKDGGSASESRAAAVTEPLKILRLNFILKIEYKHKVFLVVGNEEIIFPCWG